MTLILICWSHSVMMCSVAANASHRAANSKGARPLDAGFSTIAGTESGAVVFVGVGEV